MVMDREAWRAAIHGVAKSRTRLSDWTELNWTKCFIFIISFKPWPITSDIGRWHHPYGRKWRRSKEPLDERERGEWKSWLKAQHSENEDHGIQSHHFMANRWENSGNSVTADCIHEIKRRLLLGRKVMTNLDSILKSRDIALPTKVHLVKAMVFRVVMHGCESWTIKKSELWRIDAFELWCWRRLLRVPWTARRSNQSILKDWCWSWNSSTLATWCEELSHLKRPWCWERLRAGEGDDRGWDGWMASLTQWTWVWVDSGSWWWTGRPGVLQFMGLQRVGHDWTALHWWDSRHVLIYQVVHHVWCSLLLVLAATDVQHLHLVTNALEVAKLLFCFHLLEGVIL